MLFLLSSVFNSAIDNDVDAIVLRSFENSPLFVAEAFKEVLFKLGYEKYFKEIVFALKNSDKDTNFNTFENVFSNEIKAVAKSIPHCNYCGADIIENSKFCIKCGNEFIIDSKSNSVSCPTCGAEVLKNSKFCIMCGSKVTADKKAEEHRCSKCGADLSSESKYCLNCGTEQLGKKNEAVDDLAEDLSDTYIDIRYKLIKEIGKGGFSKVYLANDERLDRICAIKIVSKIGYTNKIASQMLLEEANKMKFLHHIAIPQLYDIYDEEKRLCIVMEYIEGSTLEKIIKDTEHPIQEDKVVDWTKQLCVVLDYLHSLNPPRIFRDVKPANIMLQPHGQIKLFDFGIMRTYDSNKDTDTCNLGTRGFAAPEQFNVSGQSDSRTDIYALGMTMHYLLTGINPIKMEDAILPITTYRPELSKRLDIIIQKCVAHNPDDRYQNCRDLLKDLEEYKNTDLI